MDPSTKFRESAEEHVSKVVVNGLRSAGADMSRIMARTTPLSLPDDFEVVRNAVEKLNARMLIVDPLSMYMNTNNTCAVRRALTAMTELAEERNLAVIGVRHLTKNSSTNSLYRGHGSIALTGPVRSVLYVGEDEELLRITCREAGVRTVR